MWKRRSSIIVAFSLVSLLLLPFPSSGQFTCTLSARDEDSCLTSADDDGSSCVWCSLAGFGFCVNEASAEAAESTLPSVSCDRAQPSPPPPPPKPSAPTKPKPQPPSATVPPKPPKTDDNIKPNDDSKVPDNFWNCLNHKDGASCKADHCTWCKTKAGYSLCMTGPTADSAKHSHFFTCDKEMLSSENVVDMAETAVEVKTTVSDPYDAACITAYLQDPTEEGCTSAVDSDGQPCKWCSLAGLTNVCLDADQADQGASLGITCQETKAMDISSAAVVIVDSVQDPYDPSCVLTMMQDPTEAGCVAAVDQEGSPCEWCSIQGRIDLCITNEQAEMSKSMGVTCDATGGGDQATHPEASMEVNGRDNALHSDPYDPSCMMTYLQDPTEGACAIATDADGNACEWCVISGFNLCLTIEQAQLSEGAGATVSTPSLDVVDVAAVTKDYQDASCIRTFFANGETHDACLHALDEDGMGCQYCTRDTQKHLCVTADQADLLSTLGFWCDHDQANGLEEEAVPDVALPDDFFKCLENYEEDGCSSAGCTWCNTQVGMGFCAADAVAESMKQCTFFDCQYKTDQHANEPLAVNTDTAVDAAIATEMMTTGSFDSTCMNAGFSNPQDGHDVCEKTSDVGGEPCVWCHTDDSMVGLCFSASQAATASSIFTCDSMAWAANTVAVATE